jgi:hypothetical protein
VSERIIVPGLTEDEQALFDVLLAKLKAKQPRNLVRAGYYDGRRAIRQVGTVIPPQYYRLGIVLGWSAKAVDILARRCNLDSFIWPDGDLEALGFRDVWEANHLGSEVSSALISSLIHGVSFLVNTRGDEQAGEPPALIHVKDALNATGSWNPRTRRLDNLLSVTGWDQQGNPTSADSYIASREDLISEAEGATDDWGPPLRRALTRALAMANGESSVPAEWRTIDAKWRSPVHLSRAAQADAGMKQLTAVPWLADSEVGLELLGLDDQQIRRALADRRRAEGRGILQTLQQAAAQVTAGANGQ